MTSKTKSLFLGAAFVLTAAGLAQAAITVADVLPTYQDGSYSAVEVRETAGQIVVEATRDGVRSKTIYDKISGAILSNQDHSANTSGAMGGRDDDSLSGDDDHGVDHGDSHGSGSDHGDSHSSGSDHGDSHGSGSDHGDSHGSGSDHGDNHGRGSDHSDNHGRGSDHSDSHDSGSDHDGGSDHD